jgi:teichuronic acid biosynthesis glycosyltransferase TuaG
MKVSIITPVYNASHFLDKTAESVFIQSYHDWEWILVDDCSTDDSWGIMQDLRLKDDRVKIYQNPRNLKSGKTRNFAIEKASGRFIAFLDSDDTWHRDKLKIQIQL